jgi:hypothetical protein
VRRSDHFEMTVETMSEMAGLTNGGDSLGGVGRFS